MIESDSQMEQAQRQLRLMQEALRSLHADVRPKNPRNFAVLAEGPMEEIRRLRSKIDEYVGVAAAMELAAPLWLRLSGPTLHWPATPVGLLTRYLESLRKGIQMVAGFLNHSPQYARLTDRQIHEACDLEVMAFQSGSILVGLRLPDVEFGRNPADHALGDLLEAARWAASKHDETIFEERYPDVERRTTLIHALKPLVPTLHGRVDRVELSGRLVHPDGGITLTNEARTRLDAALGRNKWLRDDAGVVREVSSIAYHAKLADYDGTPNAVVTFEGEIREIDLDQLRFTVRDSPGESAVCCELDQRALEPAKAALDKRVRVTGTWKRIPGKRRPGLLQVTRLELLEDEGLSGPRR